MTVSPLPPIGYLTSDACSSCTSDGFTLTCLCADNALGYKRPMSIAFAALCPNSEPIEFTYLQSGSAALSCFPLPPGDYNSTCKGCVYDGEVLTCEQCSWTPPSVKDSSAVTATLDYAQFCNGGQVRLGPSSAR